MNIKFIRDFILFWILPLTFFTMFVFSTVPRIVSLTEENRKLKLLMAAMQVKEPPAQTTTDYVPEENPVPIASPQIKNMVKPVTDTSSYKADTIKTRPVENANKMACFNLLYKDYINDVTIISNNFYNDSTNLAGNATLEITESYLQLKIVKGKSIEGELQCNAMLIYAPSNNPGYTRARKGVFHMYPTQFELKGDSLFALFTARRDATGANGGLKLSCLINVKVFPKALNGLISWEGANARKNAGIRLKLKDVEKLCEASDDFLTEGPIRFF